MLMLEVVSLSLMIMRYNIELMNSLIAPVLQHGGKSEKLNCVSTRRRNRSIPAEQTCGV